MEANTVTNNNKVFTITVPEPEPPCNKTTPLLPMRTKLFEYTRSLNKENHD